MEDLPRSGRTSTSSTEINIANVKEMVTENRYLTLREIAAELYVSHESIFIILNNFFMDFAPRYFILLVLMCTNRLFIVLYKINVKNLLSGAFGDIRLHIYTFKFFTEFKTKFNICSLFHYVSTT